VALVKDNFATSIPFDTSIVNFHTYDASLTPWTMPDELEKLVAHITASYNRSNGRNPLWRYFGLTTRGAFSPEESPLEAKMDLILSQLRDVTEGAQSITPPRPKPLRVGGTTEFDVLESKSLPELHAIANSMGVVGYQRMRKADLVKAIVAKSQGTEGRSPDE
jgi:Rho termination factor, N-terminal domain